MRFYKETKIHVLRNERVDFDGIQIIGIEYAEDADHVKNELDKLDIEHTKPAVLIYHSPLGFEDAKKAGIDLQLAGHTHNGQIYPFTLVVKQAFQYIKGLYDLDGLHLYVSPGTGT